MSKYGDNHFREVAEQRDKFGVREGMIHASERNSGSLEWERVLVSDMFDLALHGVVSDNMSQVMMGRDVDNAKTSINTRNERHVNKKRISSVSVRSTLEKLNQEVTAAQSPVMTIQRRDVQRSVSAR
jgi:hypothetical protein